MATRNIPENHGNRGRTGQSTRVLAIDVGINAVRVVEVEINGGDARLSRRGAAPLNPTYWEDMAAGREALVQAIRASMSSAGVTATRAVAGLPRRLVTLKYARLPHAEPEQIRGMVQFEAQQYIPFPLDEVVLDHQIVSDETDDMTSVMIVAARRTLVEEFLSAFDKAGIEISRLSVSALALAEHGGGSTLPLALLDIESGEMDMAVVSAGRPLFTRAASLGLEAGGEADPQRLVSEVVRSLTAYQNEYRAFPLSKVLIAGAPATLAAMEETLAGLLEIPVGRMNGQLLPASDPDALMYATAAGLALEEGGDGVSRISLIPSSRVERKAAARRKTNALAGVAVVVALIALGLFYLSQLLAAQAVERTLAARENRKLAAATAALNNVRTKHDKLLKSYQTVAAGLGRNIAAVDLVKAVSDAVPKGSGIYLTQLTFDRIGTLAIHGNAKTESAATDLVVGLQGAGPFTQVRLNYLGDAQAEITTGAAAAATVDKKPKAGQNMSFLVTCKLPVPVVDKSSQRTGTTVAQVGNTASGGVGQ